jgi:23S rRNA (adenine2503-C2)-methyltransferase
MKTIRTVEVATGHILVVKGQHGALECLSLGDYGRQHNVKADFLGLTSDIGEVEHAPILPLSDKWVITISSQYGCSMGCSFCDVPRVGPGRDASVKDMVGQVRAAMALHPEVASGRINLHFARMGEPTWNDRVLDATRLLRTKLAGFAFHPVVSTMMPRHNRELRRFLEEWLQMKADHGGDAGLQISVNSTSEAERNRMFRGNALSLPSVAETLEDLPVVGRKIALNFAVANYTIDAARLRRLFDPARFMVKLTPMHATDACLRNGIRTEGGATTLAPYMHHEQALKAQGFDVLVFVASRAEDEGRITCGNAILSGTTPYGAGLVPM